MEDVILEGDEIDEEEEEEGWDVGELKLGLWRVICNSNV